MLISLGRRASKERLVDLLAECHQRIRFFSKLAVEVARASDLDVEETRARCREVRRYFAEALPLHVADEDESIVPRLRGQSPELDRALEAMHREHGEHHALLEALDQALAALIADPTDRDRRAALFFPASRLKDTFEAHLVAEEATMLPALAGLDAGVEADILVELRGRRASDARGRPSNTT